jgi:hypothetical protein
MDIKVSDALKIVPDAASALFEADPATRSVGIGKVGDSVGFIAIRNARAITAFSAKAKIPRRFLEHFNGIPIQYQSAFADPNSLARVPHSGPASPGIGSLIEEQLLHRPLICGVQIQNFDDDTRTGEIANGYMTIGSLGCFVELQNNQIALLTNNHVAAGENRGIINTDRITQAGAMAFNANEHIATLSAFSTLLPSPIGATQAAGNVILNEIDAAIAELVPGQAWSQQYHPNRVANGPVGVSSPSLNEKVHKVGRTTGLTWGQIKQIGVVVGPVGYGIGGCWFRQSFIIEGANGTVFSNHGDSGSAIVRDSDGMVLGLLYAGNGTQTYACPIMPVLTALQCQLP